MFVELGIMSGRRNFLNSADSFCYICGSFTVPSQRTGISDFVKKAYFAYFHVKIGDQDKYWAPHIVCKPCVENLRQWTKGKRNKLAFGIPMIWREPKNHVNDCYFCLVQTSGYNKKTKKNIIYPNLQSAIRPVAHSEEIPVPVFNVSRSLEEVEDRAEIVEHDMDFEDDTGSCSNSGPQCFNQEELNDLVRDLGLSKEMSQVLASRLKEKNLLEQGTKITFYRKREYGLLQYFKVESGLVYCHDVSGLLNAMGMPSYNSNEWRLFLDSSKSSLKCVLLHNTNFYGSIPIGHSIHLKEKYQDIGTVLNLLKYGDHNWIICVDLKMVNILLGQQGGYTKYPFFVSLG